MEHPFITDLSSKTIEELQDTITGLITKINFAIRTQNSALLYQLNMALESYRTEYNKKMDELMSKQNTKIKVEK